MVALINSLHYSGEHEEDLVTVSDIFDMEGSAYWKATEELFTKPPQDPSVWDNGTLYVRVRNHLIIQVKCIYILVSSIRSYNSCPIADNMSRV